MGKDIRSFPLPDIDEALDMANDVPREIFEESMISVDNEHTTLSDSLNVEQRVAYDEILATVDNNERGMFFVDGSGGTGKTFLYKALLAMVRGQGKIAVATAASGVAASLMPGGRTAHSRFKIPLTIDDEGFCSITKQSGTTKLLQVVSLIMWDEASMTKRQAMEALDNSMCDVMGRSNVLFGEKTVVFGGDFRQVLPIVRKGSRSQIVDSMLRKSYLWERMRHLRLMRNRGLRVTHGLRNTCCASRKQFSIRLSFAMTINKSQGQTIPNFDVYLPQLVFSHGQLYVALSRATTRRNIKILATLDEGKKKEKGSKQSEICTKNIIYREVLTL
ncbi:uncharacterized protein LOC133904042 [Phragmites australis]|uniref:uncharacterized protein LOC133904042 n=1 Tax=Phragmites australis TaxID=29695 RepID=UPI002D795ED8|nr:uncharacterized protein LOC133904042 [Phragmites australis]